MEAIGAITNRLYGMIAGNREPESTPPNTHPNISVQADSAFSGLRLFSDFLNNLNCGDCCKDSSDRRSEVNYSFNGIVGQGSTSIQGNNIIVNK